MIYNISDINFLSNISLEQNNNNDEFDMFIKYAIYFLVKLII